jgi:hypothetical protein
MTLVVQEAAKQDDGGDRNRRTSLMLWFFAAALLHLMSDIPIDLLAQIVCVDSINAPHPEEARRGRPCDNRD